VILDKAQIWASWVWLSVQKRKVGPMNTDTVAIPKFRWSSTSAQVCFHNTAQVLFKLQLYNNWTFRDCSWYNWNLDKFHPESATNNSRTKNFPKESKDVRNQGGGLFNADIFRTREKEGSSDVDVRTFWCKNLITFWCTFRNLWCVRTDKGRWEVEPVRTFCGQGEGVNFSRICANVFYGRPQSI